MVRLARNIFACVVLLVPIHSSLFAQTCNWSSAVSGNWSDSTKWDCGFVPGSGNTANITVPGTYTVSLTGSVTVANLTVGASSGSDKQTLSNSGFVLQVTSSGVINANGLLSLAGTYAGNLSVAGEVVWLSGRMDSTGSTTISSGAGLTIEGAGSKTIERTLTNNGTVIWKNSGGIVAGGSFTSLIDNNALFEIQGDASLTRGNLATFNVVNDGTMRKTIATGTTSFGVSNGISFTNNGILDIQTGTIAIWGGGTIAGTTTISSGAALEFTNGSTLSGATVTGDGLLKHTSGFLTVNGSTQVENMEMSSTTTGSGTLTITKSLSWSAGTFSGAGTTIIDPAASVIISGTSTKGLQRTLRNDGVITWTGTGGIDGGNATTGLLDNNNLFEIQNDASITRGNLGNFHLLNDGILRKTTATGATGFGQASQGIQITNNGQIDLQSGTTGFYGTFSQGAGATFLLNGGDATSNPALTVGAGSFGGTGTFTGSVVNNALVHPGLSPGLLTITGNYSQGSTGTLAIELDGTTAGTTYDQLSVGGTASLNGTLDVTYPGGFVPSDADTFSIMTYTSRSGDFTTKNGLMPSAGVILTTNPTASSYDLEAASLSANLSVTKSVSPDPATPGDPLTYTINVTNSGPDAASSLTATDTLPVGVSFVSASGSGWSCGESGGVVTCTLASLGSATTSTITINATAPGSDTTITNNVSVSAATPDPDSTNNNASTSSSVVGSADLSITKSASPEPVVSGASLTYTVSVTNAGPDPASSVTVSDTLPAGVSFVSASGSGWSCGESSGVVTCTIGSLAVGMSTITIDVLAPGSAGMITNSVSVSASTPDPDGSNDSASAMSSVIDSADVSITKSASPEPVEPTSALTYTLTVSNAGPNAASNVTVSDTLPAGVSFVSASGSGWSCGESSGVVTCTIGSLAVGSSVVTIDVLAPAADGTITNNVTVSSSTDDPDGTNNSSSATSTVLSSADLSITKSASPEPVEPSSSLTYTVTVSNAGPNAASSVTVSDSLPAGVSFVSASGSGWSCSESSGVVTCTIGTLASGSSSVVTIDVLAPATDGAITNSASVSAATSDPDGSNNSANAGSNVTTAPTDADLSVTKSASPEPVMAGSSLSYTVTVSNAGPDPASSVTVSDTLPTGVSFVSASGSGWSCSESSGVVSCTTASLSVGSSVITIDVRAPVIAGTITNSVTVSSSTNDPDGTNNSASAISTVVASADLSLTKTASPEPVGSGASLSYTLTVSNAGPSVSSGVTVTDTLPAGVTFVGAGGSGWTCSEAADVVSCTTASLAVGASTISIDVMAPNAGGVITNTAAVSSSTSDPDGTNNSASAASTVVVSTSTADVSITKTASIDSIGTNDVLSYTLTVGNAGPDAASDLSVSDTVPVGTALQSVVGAGWSCGTSSGTVLCSRPSLAAGATSTITIDVQVVATSGVITNTAFLSATSSDPDSTNNQSSVATTILCQLAAPDVIVPGEGTVVPSPVRFRWSPVDGATSYELFVGAAGATPSSRVVTSDTTVFLELDDGDYDWFVTASSPSCPVSTSETVRFSVSSEVPCGPLDEITASVPGQVNTRETYRVRWTPVQGASEYELEEATDREFTDAVGTTEIELSKSFQKTVTEPTAFFYRVRALCDGQPGPFTDPVRIIVVPLPDPADPPVLTTELGNDDLIESVVFVEFPAGPFPGAEIVEFVASTDQPWLTVMPETGVMMSEGKLFDIIADPSLLPVGTSTATLIVEFSLPSKTASNGATTTQPVTVTLVTPVSPGARTFPPPADTLVIPAVAQAQGLRSQWQSNIRLTNTSTAPVTYDVTFTETGAADSVSGKQTVIEALPGQTVALDDIVRQWFGFGTLDIGVVGTLEIRPRGAGKRVSPRTSTLSSIASSRTFNATETGTFGQFVPAVPFAAFLGGPSDEEPSRQVIGLTQVEESERARTNFGVAEGAGGSATVELRVFDAEGTVVGTFPIALNPGDHRQLNGLLAQNEISLEAGRVEMEVIAGSGRITGYASVVDNVTGDPVLVPGVNQSGISASRYTLTGVANFTTERNRWRTTMSMLNVSEVATPITLTFYPQGDPLASVSAEMMIEGNRLVIFEELLSTQFGITDTGGMVHVTTPAESSLLISAKTFDSRLEGGTYGQFIPAILPDETFGIENRPLQILQLEESGQFRSNVGVAEVTGSPVTILVSATAPGTIVEPSVTLELEGFEFIQLVSVLRALGFTNVYNARITIQVIEGEGRITAYGSVIDNRTQDPTFVPAQ